MLTFRRFTQRALALALLLGVCVAAGIQDRESFQAQPVLCAGFKSEGAAKTHTLGFQLVSCKSGPWGPFTGKRVGSPNRCAPWARGSAYGHASQGTTASSTSSMRAIRKKGIERGVPWPNPKSKRALTDMAAYDVYTIYVRTAPGSHRTFKYGITKVGAKRPRSQLKRCRKIMARMLEVKPSTIECEWRWAREGVPGFFKARQVEAAYATNYKGAFGKCPPGMLKCI